METKQIKYELCVIEGSQQGSRQPLKTAQAHGIGNSFDCDIYLHGDEDTNFKMDILPGRLSIAATLISGEAILDSKAMVVGQKVKLPIGVPVRLGQNLFVVENASQTADSEARDKGDSGKDQQSDVAKVVADDSDGMESGDVVVDTRVLSRFLQPRALLMLVGVGLLLGGVQAWRVAPDSLAAAKQTLTLEEHVRASVEADVSVMATDEGAYMVKGWLPTRDAERQLNKALLQRSEDVVLKTSVTTDIEASITEVFRTHGIAGDVSTLKPGRVVVRTSTADLEQLAKAERSAKADVHGLEELSVVNTAPKQATSTPSKRKLPNTVDQDIQLVVVGETSYVITEDQATYFLGSKLPTGHRIESIVKDKVVVSKNGVTTELMM